MELRSAEEVYLAIWSLSMAIPQTGPCSRSRCQVAMCVPKTSKKSKIHEVRPVDKWFGNFALRGRSSTGRRQLVSRPRVS